MKRSRSLSRLAPAVIGLLLSGCVTKSYQPGAEGNALRRLQLGQTYGDMVRLLGEPDSCRSEDRSGQETAALFVPVWGVVESVADLNPSAIEVYTYDRWGTVTIANGMIRRIEAK